MNADERRYENFLSALIGVHGRPILFALCILALCGCNSGTPKQASVATAFAGPHALNLRKDLGPKSPTVATIQHGEAVEVLETRRRFVKVRTAQGAEGWTDENLLLSEKQMSGLRWLADNSKQYPSQGTATVYDTLNLHVDPTRQSPSFSQIAEGQTVEVIGHRLTTHRAVAPSVTATVRPAAKKKSGKEKKKTTFDLPLPPAAPPPAHWLDLSRPRGTDVLLAAKPLDASQQPGGDDWSLVRLKDGRVGWVLARMLSMALPDEVAQYAEGKRITAYLSLGDVKDKDGAIKHNWLWTTQGPGLKPYEFDSFRVFVWSITRHRYETALIERNVKGFYPVEPVAQPGEDRKGFTLVMEDKDGQLYRRTYAFSGYHVRMTDKTPYKPPPDALDLRTVGFDAPVATEVAEAGWKDRVKDWFGKLRR